MNERYYTMVDCPHHQKCVPIIQYNIFFFLNTNFFYATKCPLNCHSETDEQCELTMPSHLGLETCPITLPPLGKVLLVLFI